jgi:hypothetical protein
MISVRLGLPYVRVPVLSKMTVRQEPIRSSIAGSLMMMARLAAVEIAPIIATGIASNSGHGVAMTNTAKNRVGSLPITQPNAANETPKTVYHVPSRSAIRRIRGRFASASCMTRIIFA